LSNFYQSLPKPFFVLAPMDDVTDTVFRQIINSLSRPDVFFTEFVNVDGLMSPGADKLIGKLAFNDQEKPIVVQIWGKNPDNFFSIAQRINQEGRFSGIDLNFGCPDKTVVKNGCCSALINNRPLAKDIIQATIDGAGSLPVSVKTRLGFNEIDLTWIEFLLGFSIQLLTIHNRTKKQMSKTNADWTYMKDIKKIKNKINPSVLLVGNGDVADRSIGLELAKEYDLDGIMIGRGILKNPLAFSSNFNIWNSYSINDKISLFRQHLNLFQATYTSYGDQKLFKLFKFAKLYLNDFEDSSHLRQLIMSSQTIEEVNQVLDNFINHQ
jgi:tRNA-dihydrouridine synthase